MSLVNIVPWCEDFLEPVRELIEQLGYPLSSEDLKRSIANLTSNSHDWIYVALVEGRPLGLMHLKRQFQIHTPVRLEVVALVVDQNFRGTGVGTRLLQQADAIAHQLGLPEIVLHSSIKRENAHAFYEKYGYARAKTSYWFSRLIY